LINIIYSAQLSGDREPGPGGIVTLGIVGVTAWKAPVLRRFGLGRIARRTAT
jgi:hypothetical protein